jgi:Ca2+-binding RTX toxin-like protein
LATITGTSGDDTLTGGSGPDTLKGGLGNDRYVVSEATDQVVELAGEGNDRVLAGVSYALAAGASVETLTTTNNAGTAALNLTGNELAQAIYGNAGANVLTGGAGNDALVGLEGNDVLVGGTGTDTLNGGFGDDVFYVDTAGDVVAEAAGQGNDRIYASASYSLAAGSSVETLTTTDNAGTVAINLTGNELAQAIYGNAGANRLNGGAGNDALVGLAGNDVLIGGTGIDVMNGGLGDDQFYVDAAGDTVAEAAGQGNDRVFASASYTLVAGLSIETLTTTDNAGTAAINLTGNELAQAIYGNAGTNRLNGGAGNDALVGFAGNDVLVGGVGTDVMNGGLGDDMFYVDAAADVVAEAAGQGTDRVLAAASYTLAAGVSVETLTTTDNAGTAAINLTGNEIAQTLYGNAGANTLNGGAGSDVLVGFAGNDVLVGGTGIDTMNGGLGDDRFYVDAAGDVVLETAGQGTDRVLAAASYALTAGRSIETLTTTDNAGTGAINLTGNEIAQTLYGNAGANVLDGKGGADTLVGLGGNDSYYVDAAGDIVSEAAGGGTDTVYASATYALAAGAEIEALATTAAAGTSAINLTGSATAQTITGNAGANVLDGKGGADTLIGLGGNDTYVVDSAGDVVQEVAGGGSDTIQASVSYTLAAGVDVETLIATAAINLTGNALAQAITGSAGVNALNGGGGNDVLNGLSGNDTLTGGAGADRFSFTAALGAGNVDTITDFEPGVDKIVLGGLPGEAFAALASGLLSDLSFATWPTAQQPYEVIFYNSATGALLYDADGNGAGVAVQFAKLAPNLYLSWSDFRVSGPENTAPTILSGATASVAENSSASTVVYQAQATDADGDRIVWWLDGYDAELLTIDQSGAVRLAQPADFETKSVYNFTVVASDSGVLHPSKAVQLTVENLPEPTPAIVEKSGENGNYSTTQWIGRDSFAVETNANLPNDELPSVTISGSIADPADVDYYGVQLEAGEVLYLDIDNSSGNLDAFVELFRINGGERQVVFNDDLGPPDPGSEPHPEYGHNTDSFIRIRVATPGSYVFAVSAFDDPERPTSGSYQLNVSIGPPVSAAELWEEDVQALISGAQWDHTNLTYGFPTSATQYPAGIEETDEAGEFAPFTPTQQAAVTANLASIAALTGLTFSAAADAATANLRYAMTGNADPAYAYYPTGDASGMGGTAWFDKVNFNLPERGGYAWMGFLHETGHALGLKHGHESPPISTGHDSLEFTVMTYRSYVDDELEDGGGLTNETYGFPSTLMMLDIAALQQMYGANFTTNAGNTAYSWSPTTGEMSINGAGQGAPGGNRIFMTVWDGGGTDTYDLSNYSSGVTIDLRPGGWTITSGVQAANLGAGHYARGNIANALLYEGDPRSLIENAVGTSADDTLYGNDIANTLTGGAGNDRLEGFGGNDTLIGGDGYDSLSGNAGNDILYGERLDGGDGNDLLNGGTGSDEIFGGAGSDEIHGGAGADQFSGGADNDKLYGEDDNDSMEGGDGDDILAGGSGNDSLYGGNGNDNLTSGPGSNNLYGDGGDDYLVGGDGLDVLTGGEGVDVLVGGLGDDHYWLGTDDQIIELPGEGEDRAIVYSDYTAPTEIEGLYAAENFAISLTGNNMNNVLYGNNNTNVLDGGIGSDVLVGRLGEDTFAFSTALGSGNVDTIDDFAAADDTIRLEDAVFVGLTAGVLAAGAFNTGAAATQADDRIIYNQVTGALLFDIDGSGASAAVQFATLFGAPTVAASDFLVV